MPQTLIEYLSQLKNVRWVCRSVVETHARFHSDTKILSGNLWFQHFVQFDFTACFGVTWTNSDFSSMSLLSYLAVGMRYMR